LALCNSFYRLASGGDKNYVKTNKNRAGGTLNV